MSNQNMSDPPKLTDAGWLRLLSAIFGTDFSGKLDSIDLNCQALNTVLASLEEQTALVLWARFEAEMTRKEIGVYLVRNSKTGPLTSDKVRRIIENGLRKLRHPTHLRVIIANITAPWNLGLDLQRKC